MHLKGSYYRLFGFVSTSFLSAVLTGGTAQAVTLLVPSQYATIQAAIDAAQPGDTVVVAPGTYNEEINLLGKAITVRSSAGAATTGSGHSPGGGAARLQWRRWLGRSWAQGRSSCAAPPLSRPCVARRRA